MAALYAATRGRTGVFVTIAEVAWRADIPEGDVERVVGLAERAGFIGRYMDDRAAHALPRYRVPSA
ncbi:MAG: hypothetical protein U1E60_06650 [Reyranellaceae bacterium]